MVILLESWRSILAFYSMPVIQKLLHFVGPDKLFSEQSMVS